MNNRLHDALKRILASDISLQQNHRGVVRDLVRKRLTNSAFEAFKAQWRARPRTLPALGFTDPKTHLYNASYTIEAESFSMTKLLNFIEHNPLPASGHFKACKFS